MGLDIGISVKRQVEGWGETGRNPKGTLEEIAERCDVFVRQRVPEGYGPVSAYLNAAQGEYSFDIHVFRYGSELPQPDGLKELYLALVSFIIDEFGLVDGIEMQTFYSA